MMAPKAAPDPAARSGNSFIGPIPSATSRGSPRRRRLCGITRGLLTGRASGAFAVPILLSLRYNRPDQITSCGHHPNSIRSAATVPMTGVTPAGRLRRRRRGSPKLQDNGCHHGPAQVRQTGTEHARWLPNVRSPLAGRTGRHNCASKFTENSYVLQRFRVQYPMERVRACAS